MSNPEIIDLLSGLLGIVGTILSIIFYFREKLSAQELENEKKRVNELRTMIHWQLQAIHHECNRVENIIVSPERPDKGVIEVARSIRDSVDAIMGQLLGDVFVFPWGNIPVRDPKTGKKIGRIFDGTLYYKDNDDEVYDHTIDGKYPFRKVDDDEKKL